MKEKQPVVAVKLEIGDAPGVALLRSECKPGRAQPSGKVGSVIAMRSREGWFLSATFRPLTLFRRLQLGKKLPDEAVAGGSGHRNLGIEFSGEFRRSHLFESPPLLH